MFAGWPTAEALSADPSEAVFSWLVGLRWVAVLGVASILVLSGPALHRLPAESTPWLWSTAAALALFNASLYYLGPNRGPPWLSSFAVQITVDCVALATLVHFAGGLENPFLSLFVLHAVNANIVLSRRDALRVLGVATALVVGIVLAEGAGLVAHHCLRGGAGACSSGGVGLHTAAALGGLVLTLALTSLFTRLLTAMLRQNQQKLEAAIGGLRAEKDRLLGARAELETERERLQAIIDCMGDAVSFEGPSGEVLFSNQAARALWPAGAREGGSTREALDGQTSRVDPGEGSFVRAGRTFDSTQSLVCSPRGEPLGRVLVARDITDRLAIERHLMHDEQMNVVGKLAAAIAHEVNNPIGVILLYSQHALAALSTDDPVYEHLATIHRNADECRKIVGGLLGLARRQEPRRRSVDLQRLCREVVESIRPLAARAGARIASEVHDEEASVWIRADPGMLRQAVLNLAVNAVEAATPGSEIAIGVHETQEGGRTAHVVEVRDNGAGMATEQLEQIFQPFFTTKSSGTGLGLSIAESVVKSHDGRIDVTSVVGSGTTFRIVLPDHTRGSRSSGSIGDGRIASVGAAVEGRP